MLNFNHIYNFVDENIMKSQVLSQLQWPQLLENLSANSQTVEAKKRCLNLRIDLNQQEILDNWNNVLPLREINNLGYSPPIGDIPDLNSAIRGAKVGQVLDGVSFREIHVLLDVITQVLRFCNDFSSKCSTLEKFRSQVYPLPKLLSAIDKAISEEGDIRDNASFELSNIRKEKISMRRKIESTLKQILSDSQMEIYLQDKFFTIRSDRYVVPMRLDGRGRIKGSIYDTSDSGQTLYIEPSKIAPMNEELLELELSEKIEILRIFRDLSSHTSSEIEIIETNYQEIIKLDFLNAQAAFSSKHSAGAVEIVDQPTLFLKEARHPLVSTPSGQKAIENDIWLHPEQKALIVSGPNAGGKTVVLKTTGLLHLMLKAGLLLPCNSESKFYIFQDICLSLGDSQDISQHLSTFSGHINNLKPIIENASSNTLTLLDEIAVGTEPQTGSALAQSILEFIADKNSTIIATTHFDPLKGLAIKDKRFRNGSMEFSRKNLQPTYRLILDLPGQSYGIEVASKLGLPEKVINRAKELKGDSHTSVDQLVDSLLQSQQEAQKEKEDFYARKLEMEAQKTYWEREKIELTHLKKKSSEKVKAKYEATIDTIKEELYSTLEDFKKLFKDLRTADTPIAIQEVKNKYQLLKKQAEGSLSDFGSNLDSTEKEFQSTNQPKKFPLEMDSLKTGMEVFIDSIKKMGKVINILSSEKNNIEVQAGLLKLKTDISNLYLLKNSGSNSSKTTEKKKASPKNLFNDKNLKNNNSLPALVIPSPTNSLNLRGMHSEEAIQRIWEFIDKAVLRGEQYLILIHGHGTDVLKKSIRTELAARPLYELDFRPGEKEEGGDGVTIISLR